MSMLRLTPALREKIKARGFPLPEEAEAIRAEEADAAAERGELPVWHPESVATRYSHAMGNAPPDAREFFAVFARRLSAYLDAGKSLGRSLEMLAEDAENDGQTATCDNCNHVQPYRKVVNADGDTVKPTCRVCAQRKLTVDAPPEDTTPAATAPAGAATPGKVAPPAPTPPK